MTPLLNVLQSIYRVADGIQVSGSDNVKRLALVLQDLEQLIAQEKEALKAKPAEPEKGGSENG